MSTGQPALTPGYDATLSPYKHDLDKAKALMKESGVTTPVVLDLAVRIGWQPHEEAAIWIQRELDTFVERGFQMVSIGTPVLRVEAALSAVLGQLLVLQRLRTN